MPARPSRLVTHLFLPMMATLQLTACSGPRLLAPGDGEAAVDVSVMASDVVFSGMSVEISGPGITEPLVQNLSDGGDGVWTGSIEVPVGADRHFLARGYDTGGSVTHEGEATADVTAETNESVQITLAPVTGDVPVTGTVGSYTVSITPDSASVSVGGIETLTSTITDQDGSAVSGTVTWAVKNPALVDIAASGNTVEVTGAVAGTTEVIATYKGFAASATITVN